MTIIIAGAAGSLATSGMISGIIIGATAGLGIGIGSQISGTAGTAAGIAGAVGASASAGAIIGTAVGKGLDGALTGGVVAIASSYMTSATHMIHSGPIGWLLLGAEASSSSTATCTFDCWKPVLHDHSIEPSAGKMLRDVIMDSRIKHVTTMTQSQTSSPEIIVENIWNEQFRIEYVTMPNKQMAAHAVLL